MSGLQLTGTLTSPGCGSHETRDIPAGLSLFRNLAGPGGLFTRRDGCLVCTGFRC